MKHNHTAFILAVVLLTACASNQKKAERLISDYFYATLYDYDSYQVVETTLEETEMTPYFDESCKTSAEIGVTARKMHHEAMDSFNDAFEIMKIWGGSWDSYSRDKYREAKNEASKQFADAKKYLLLSFDMQLDLKDKADSLAAANSPAGWTVTQKYRCKSKGGYALLCNDVFLVDPKFKEILLHISLDDEDEQEIQDFITETVVSQRDSILSQKTRLESIAGF